ncbi:MAG: isoleucine--tRNA ligase [Lentisphaeria bacterium]
MFDPVPGNVSFPKLEEDVLKFWRDNGTFEKSLKQREGGDSFVFYDGPPFATGLPHYGHLLAGTIKDVVPRYQTMRGKHVPRTFGWDCHGLPVENEVEKQLSLASKTEIEQYGVAKFNEACRSIVLRYTSEWEQVVERTGRWVDFRHGYRTMDRDYMESIWWVFKQLWDQGLIYDGHKILPYCPRCATPLSNFEANQGYETVQDPSITVRFKAAGAADRWFLVWTTTPWTLPSNMALAVHPEVEYVCVRDGATEYILAAARLEAVFGHQPPPVVSRCRGADLVGQTYEPMFAYFTGLGAQGAFRVIPAEFVSTDDGTGLVHIAPGFGEDDAVAGRAHGVPLVCPVDAECRFTADVPDYQGRFVKETDKDILARLKHEGKLIHRATIEHSYPHCWRCESPLIYRAVSTWFVRVEQIKERLLNANRQIHWMPEHLRDGRFGNWLKNAHDWAISRNRYWGCPLPIWRSADGREVRVFGSVAELEQATGRPVTDLHKHFVDELVVPPATAGGEPLHRVPEVLDCWFESGSMPYAQHHYPFANKKFVEDHFPADFIAEGLDQTRGWFYTLVVLGAALFDKPAFKNVVVNGLVLAEDGRKMSKRLKNYPDPMVVMGTEGADALRLCLLASPVVRAEDLRFSEKGVREVLRSVLLPLWNSYSFLVTYARVDGWTPAPGGTPPAAPANVLDRWVLSRLDETVEEMRAAMDAYDLQHAATRFTGFLDDLTNWYIRRSRRRFWKSQNDSDKAEAYATLHHVLLRFCQMAAPFIPFITETIYRNLRTPDLPESVHLCDYPTPAPALRDAALNRRMARTMTAVSLGRYLRNQTSLRVRQPLAKAVLVATDPEAFADFEAMREVIADELNVKAVEVSRDEEVLVRLSAKANFKVLGKKLGKRMKAAATAIEALPVEPLRELRAGRPVTLPLDDGGEPVAVTAEDVLIQRQEREGMTVANEGDITVALDTRLDEALLREGWARDIVSRIQALRKDAGLDVADRIRVCYEVPAEAAAAITAFAGHITAETLAVELTPAVNLPVDALAEVNGVECKFVIAKA